MGIRDLAIVWGIVGGVLAGVLLRDPSWSLGVIFVIWLVVMAFLAGYARREHG